VETAVFQRCDSSGKIGNLKDHPVPSAGFLLRLGRDLSRVLRASIVGIFWHKTLLRKLLETAE
jgi:hypothetical protein